MKLFDRPFKSELITVNFPVSEDKTETVVVDYNRLFLLAHKLTYPDSKIVIKNGQIYYDAFPDGDNYIKNIFRVFLIHRRGAFNVSYVMKKESIDRFVNALKLMNLKYKKKIFPNMCKLSDGLFVNYYIEVIPKTKVPVYQSIIKFIQTCNNMDKMITVRDESFEFKIHEFILDYIDAKYFNSMKNFKEGVTGVIEIKRYDPKGVNLKSFYDFCYLDINEWKEKYKYSTFMIEIIFFADFLDCEKFFNVALSTLVEYHVQLRDILLEFQFSQINNKYYREIMDEIPYDAEEYEDMIIFRFKQMMINRKDSFEMFYMKEDISYIHLFEHEEDEIWNTRIFRIKVEEKKIVIYFFNLFLSLNERIMYIAFKDGKTIECKSLIRFVEDYVKKFFKDKTDINRIKHYDNSEEKFIHTFIQKVNIISKEIIITSKKQED